VSSVYKWVNFAMLPGKYLCVNLPLFSWKLLSKVFGDLLGQWWFDVYLILFHVSCIFDPVLGDYVWEQHSLDIITLLLALLSLKTAYILILHYLSGILVFIIGLYCHSSVCVVRISWKCSLYTSKLPSYMTWIL